jgi:hypothetical protein
LSGERTAYRVLVEKPERKGPLGRPKCGWVDNIKMDHREIGWGVMNWIGLAQDREQWKVRWFTSNSGKFLSNCITGGL